MVVRGALVVWMLVALAFWMVACDPAPSATRAAVVYDTDDRLEVYEHPSALFRGIAETAIAMSANARALDESDPARVVFTYARTLGEAKSLCPGESFADQIEPGLCSGTLIDERHLLTAAHCVDSARDCDGSRVWVFGFRQLSEGSLAPLTSDDVYRCANIRTQLNDGAADYAVVELDRPVVGRAPVALRPMPAGLPLGTPLILIGHPNGIPMKIASGGEVTVTDGEGVWLKATVDAFHGNSGSGVFDDTGALVALLDGGETDYIATGACNVVNVISPAPSDDGESLTYLRPALDAFCALPGLDSTACACDGPCVPIAPADSCATAEMIEGRSQVLSGPFVGFTNTTEGSCGGVGPDRVWVFDLTEERRITAQSSGFDTVLYLHADCGGTELACNDDIERGSDRRSRFEVIVPPGRYALTLDAYDSEVDAFTLDLEIAPVVVTLPDAGGLDDAGVDSGGVPDSAVADGGDAGVDASSAIPHGGGGCSVSAARSAKSHGSLAFMLVVGALGLARRRH